MSKQEGTIGYMTIVKYAPLSSDVVRFESYWKSIYDPSIKTSTVEDLESILNDIR